jgi:hypothetical protein
VNSEQSEQRVMPGYVDFCWIFFLGCTTVFVSSRKDKSSRAGERSPSRTYVCVDRGSWSVRGPCCLVILIRVVHSISSVFELTLAEKV